jgi:DNA repair ATPase RecN
MIDREPGFTVRGLRGHTGAGEQMAFQNLLLLLGADAVEEFGDKFLKRLVRALWKETDVVNEERAEELLADALSPGGRKWLASRLEF